MIFISRDFIYLYLIVIVFLQTTVELRMETARHEPSGVVEARAVDPLGTYREREFFLLRTTPKRCASNLQRRFGKAQGYLMLSDDVRELAQQTWETLHGW